MESVCVLLDITMWKFSASNALKVPNGMVNSAPAKQVTLLNGVWAAHILSSWLEAATARQVVS